MLRDLRVTFDKVELRPGGESIALLGELAVDQRAYAEVGVPMPARVTCLAVQAGERVQVGQVLAELTSPDLGKARADYLSAEARVTLAEAALARKRGLAGEQIVPLREVQEAESAAAEARGVCGPRARRSGGSAWSRPPQRPTRRPRRFRSAPPWRASSLSAPRSSGRCWTRRRRRFGSETCPASGSPCTPSSGTRSVSCRA